ncbi:MAG: hypothetical protein LBT51_06640 [Fusobacteriaceae bacterium]|jgi:hypothetical protein|nr:hypothetical protein [Fusobacteriaceae bacterium]
MYKNFYGTMLKSLLSFSDIKCIIVGNHLGYDVSYISKWCNSVKLPSSKVIREINKQLSELIGKEILETKNILSFLNKFEIEIPKNTSLLENKKFLEEQINELLTIAYDESSEHSGEEKMDFLVGSDEIKTFLEDNIKNTVIESNKNIDIFLSLDILAPGNTYILSLLSKLKPKNIKINVYTGISLDEINNNSYFKRIYFLLNKFANLNIELYNIKDFKNLNSIVIKNKISFCYSMNKEGIFESITFTKSKLKILKNYETIKKYMTLENNFLRIRDPESLIKNDFRVTFYSDNYFNFLITHGFEFLLPQTIMNNILDFAEKNSRPSYDILDIKKLIITLTDTFVNSTINFFILKSSLLKFFQDRRIFFMNIEYEIMPSEIKEYYSYFIEILKLNKEISFYIIDDDKLDTGYLEFNVSIYSNNNTVFFKNQLKIQQRQNDFFSVINDTDLVRDINLSFDDLKKSPLCKKYSMEKIEKAWEKYQNMLFKIMDIKR